MAGNANSGMRKDVAEKVNTFKRVAWDLIVRRCSQGAPPKSKDEWIEYYTQMFANKMMPQVLEGAGDNGEFETKEVFSEQEMKLYEQFKKQFITSVIVSSAEEESISVDSGQSDKNKQGNSI